MTTWPRRTDPRRGQGIVELRSRPQLERGELVKPGTSLRRPAGTGSSSFAPVLFARPSWVPSGIFGPAMVVLCAVLAGYLFFNRPFAYLAIPGTPAFVGELALALLLLQVARVPASVRSLLRDSVLARILAGLLVLTFGMMVLGLGEHGIDAPRDAAPMLYGLFAIGIAVVLARHPELLEIMVRWYRRIIPWFLLWAPISIILARTLAERPWHVPGSETPIFAFKAGDTAVQIGAALAFLWIVGTEEEEKPWRQRLLLFLGLIGLLAAGSVNRGGFAAAAVMLLVAFLRYVPQPGRLFAIGGGMLGFVLVVGLVTDVEVNVGGDREVSVQQLLTNVLVTFGADVEEQSNLEANVSWRLGLWGEVIDDVESGGIGVTGLGLGPNLADRYGYATTADDAAQRLRSVHNSHLTVLARWGLLGTALWLLFWGLWFRSVDRIGRSARSRTSSIEARVSAWAVTVILGLHVNAFFDAALEGPHAAIWLWVVAGVGLATTRWGATAQPRSSIARSE
jgi:hypothetical protein